MDFTNRFVTYEKKIVGNTYEIYEKIQRETYT